MLLQNGAKLREMLFTHKDILLKLEKLERKAVKHAGDIQLIFKYLKELLSPKTEPLRKIGFKHKKEDQFEQSIDIRRIAAQLQNRLGHNTTEPHLYAF